MIKKIHYIWLGKKQKGKLIEDCIASWRKYFPGWEIIEWNEDNIDLNINQYCLEAYKAQKYAFASDAIRFDILYKYGGIYFDTDVKVIKSFKPLLEKYNAFCGFENDKYVAPGLVLYCGDKGNYLANEMANIYKEERFIEESGKFNEKTVVTRFTEILENYGLKKNNTLQTIEQMTIFPTEYFCPISYLNEKNFTNNTYSIHLYAGSWISRSEKIKRKVRILFGNNIWNMLKKYLKYKKEY